MKKIISLTESSKKLISDLEFLSSLCRYQFIGNGGQDVDLETIKAVCAEVWKISITDLNKNERYKDSLLFAASIFSNMRCDALAKKINRYSQSLDIGIARGHRIIYTNRKWADVFLKILETLNDQCPGRISRLATVTFTMIEGVADGSEKLSEWGSKTPINPQEFPLREKTWFYNNNRSFKMFSFSLCGSECKLIIFSRTRDYELLYRMQDRGYRFIAYDQLFYKVMTDNLIESNKMLEKSAEVMKQTNDRLMEIAEHEQGVSNSLYKEVSYEEVVKLAFDIDTDNEKSKSASSILIKAKKIYNDISNLKFLMPIKNGLEFRIA